MARELGISTVSLSRYEQGHRKISKALAALARHIPRRGNSR